MSLTHNPQRTGRKIAVTGGSEAHPNSRKALFFSHPPSSAACWWEKQP